MSSVSLVGAPLTNLGTLMVFIAMFDCPRLSGCLHVLGRAHGRFENVRIGSAAAEVALNPFLQFRLGGIGMSIQIGRDRGDKSAGAHAAHHAILLAEGSLHRRELVGSSKAFNGG